jgi:hypothetical protein
VWYPAKTVRNTSNRSFSKIGPDRVNLTQITEAQWLSVFEVRITAVVTDGMFRVYLTKLISGYFGY